MDLDICHFVQYRPQRGEFDPMQLEVTIVHRDREWFSKYLPLFQKFITDLQSFKEGYEGYIKQILPKEKDGSPVAKKRKFDSFLIKEDDDIKNDTFRDECLEM